MDGRKLGESSNFNATVNVTGTIPNKITNSGYGVGEAAVLGSVQNSVWTAPSGIKVFAANSFVGTTMTIGKVGNLFNGLKGGAGAIAFQSTNITAGQVTKIAVSNVDESGSGSTFGIVVDSYRNYDWLKDGEYVASKDGALDLGDADSVGKYRFHANQAYSV